MSKVRCKECREYVDKDDAIRIGLSSWCSNGCLNADRFSKPKPKKKSNKKVASEPKDLDYGKISPEVYDAVLQADSNRCRLCGGTENLAVHHIFYRSEAKYFPWCSQRHNLITLCNQECHLNIVHKDKKKYKPLCLQIVWLREINNDRYTLIKDIE